MSVVSIVVPSYRGLHPEAVTPLLAMQQQTNCLCRDARGVRLHEPWNCAKGKHCVRMTPPMYLSSVVHWARNQNIALAMYGAPEDGTPPADYFFLQDDDMVGQPGDLQRLLAYKLDIVCGICTIKRDPPRPNIRFWRPDMCRFVDPIEWDWDATKLMEIDAAGAAFMVVKRRVFERMEQAYLDCEFERMEDERKFGSSDKIVDYWKKRAERRHEVWARAKEEKNWGMQDFWPFQFLANAEEGQIGELGEDVGFCWKAKKLGFRIFADPQVLPGHLGAYSYSIRDYRAYIEAGQASGQFQNLEENKVALCV
jgi:hypothetical protein